MNEFFERILSTFDKKAINIENHTVYAKLKYDEVVHILVRADVDRRAIIMKAFVIELPEDLFKNPELHELICQINAKSKYGFLELQLEGKFPGTLQFTCDILFDKADFDDKNAQAIIDSCAISAEKHRPLFRKILSNELTLRACIDELEGK